MPQTQVISLHEKLAVGMQVLDLKKQGKFEEADKLQKSMPLPAYLAKWVKKRFGADALIKTGWNLSEAEAEYGPDWLAQ